MASLCRFRVLSSIQNFARIQHIRSIATRSSSFAALQQGFGNSRCNQNNLKQRITELNRPVRHYGSAAEMTISSIQERCTLVLKLFDKVDPDKVTLDAKFAEDLGLDSLDAVEIIMAMEDEFGVEIPDETAEKLLNLKDVVECLADRLDVAH
ncbi:acyl carrier protein, mitochondrial-like [Lytechinus pictus]|uniref:acyl carrier protein, mitochondrial-like n=1 Tax=Lytechinus pictus TaxID=7653 RepID=UPI00240E57B4|nr:acyl carrier protein, mitochondrial-like [Lytechinus pictus]